MDVPSPPPFFFVLPSQFLKTQNAFGWFDFFLSFLTSLSLLSQAESESSGRTRKKRELSDSKEVQKTVHLIQLPRAVPTLLLKPVAAPGGLKFEIENGTRSARASST